MGVDIVTGGPIYDLVDKILHLVDKMMVLVDKINSFVDKITILIKIVIFTDIYTVICGTNSGHLLLTHVKNLATLCSKVLKFQLSTQGSPVSSACYRIHRFPLFLLNFHHTNYTR